MAMRSDEQSLSLDENILSNNLIFSRQVAYIGVDWRRYYELHYRQDKKLWADEPKLPVL